MILASLAISPVAARKLSAPSEGPEAKLAAAIKAARSHVDFSRPAILIARKDAEGTVRVEIHRPTSRLVGEGGRRPSRKVLTVEFAGSRYSVKPESGEDDVPSQEVAAKETARKAGAAAAAVSHLQAKGWLGSEIEVSVAPDGKGYSVLVWRIPYTPGGHSITLVDPDLAVRRVVPGR